MNNISTKSAKAEAQYANASAAMTANRDRLETMLNGLSSKEAETADGRYITYFTNSKGANIEFDSISILACLDWEDTNESSWEMHFYVNVYNSDFTKKAVVGVFDDSEEYNCTSLCKYLFEMYSPNEGWENTICIPEDYNNSILMAINLGKLISEIDELPSLDNCETMQDYPIDLIFGWKDLVEKNNTGC